MSSTITAERCLMRPADPGDVQPGRVGAPVGGADQRLRAGGRDRLGQRRHQRHDPHRASLPRTGTAGDRAGQRAAATASAVSGGTPATGRPLRAAQSTAARRSAIGSGRRVVTPTAACIV